MPPDKVSTDTLHYLDEHGDLIALEAASTCIDVQPAYVVVWNADRTRTALIVPLARVRLIRADP